MLYIASDHGGYKLKEDIKKFLTKKKIKFQDLGPFEYDPFDDYPDYAKLVAEKISKAPDVDQGILLCRSGQGVCITANKFKKVRAALVWTVIEAKISRKDDMSNIICLPSDYISPHQACLLVETWLKTPYSNEERHRRRVAKIAEIEQEERGKR